MMTPELSNFILYGFLPLVVLFIFERFFFAYFMAKTEARRNIIRNSFFLHPNFITKLRYPIGIVSVLIFHYFSQQAAFILWAVFMMSDLTDGTIAQRYNLITIKGASIDPLSDKLLQIPILFYLVYLGAVNFWLVFIYAFVDFLGQYLRSVNKVKRANIFGKVKTFLIVIVITVSYTQYTYWDKLYLNLAPTLLSVSLALALLSMFFRTIPNYWYGNLLTLTNFLCGVLGIILIILGYPVEYAFLLIFFGQFLDLYDGRAVKKWGGTQRGELYDDLADGTNFGGTVSFIILYTINEKILAIPLSIIYFSFTVYRLYRFIHNKREQNIGKDEGVEIFQGLPTPASASFVGAGLILLNSTDFLPFLEEQVRLILQVIIILLSSFLMISKIPYTHFAKKVLPSIPTILKVISMALIILLLIWSFDNSNFLWLNLLLFLTTISYLVFGIAIAKKTTK